VRRAFWNGKRKMLVLRPAEAGFALIAALMVMLLTTALGIMAVVTSTSEVKLTNNLSEEKIMFNYGQQAVDRVLSHMHYMDQGLFGTTEGGMGLADTGVTQVLDKVRRIFINPFGTANAPSTKDDFVISAWLDPQNLEGSYDEGYSRNVAITVRVETNLGSSIISRNLRRAFRAKVRPFSIWDFAYFSQNHNPAARQTAHGNCNLASNLWYNCQAVFHNSDHVIGDVYVRTAEASNDDTVLYMRGGPIFSGRVMWRGLRDFDYGDASFNNSDFQTKGGKTNPPQPKASQGFRPYSKEISMFPIDNLESGSTEWFRDNADIILTQRPGYIYKLVFRNDLDVDENGDFESESRVSSRINFEVNNGSRETTDAGVFILYSLPWSDDLSTQNVLEATFQEKRAAFWGDSMRRRDREMTSISGGERWNTGKNWVHGDSENLCYDLVFNTTATQNKKPFYDAEDIEGTYYYIVVPSVNSPFPSTGSGDCSGTGNGIIYVQGDVMVEGIVDGKVTIVAAGNIYLSHEVQYEEKPVRRMSSYSSPDDIDMLGLFATGNIIIPTHQVSFTDDQRPSPDRSTPYLDDWTDPPSTYPGFQGTGQLDHPAMENDDGNEEINAVMVSFGYGKCTFTGSTASCAAPDATAIRDFRVGLYSLPLTHNGNAWTGVPYHPTSGYYPEHNDAGTLTIWGALIQNYPGRVSFDHSSSTCEGGYGPACRNLGHKLVIKYDDHLKYTLPAHPYQISANKGIPYGQAAWTITEWQKIKDDEVGKEYDFN